VRRVGEQTAMSLLGVATATASPGREAEAAGPGGSATRRRRCRVERVAEATARTRLGVPDWFDFNLPTWQFSIFRVRASSSLRPEPLPVSSELRLYSRDSNSSKLYSHAPGAVTGEVETGRRVLNCFPARGSSGFLECSGKYWTSEHVV
jgi:hypothetical protein